eukprot:TRINITY_DN113065_c0_g1_i1.p1 TRINITY_DN113065_c0_g1~~TRINITY_DN113065_c0_g1_i1.p1  ORF type:complete len:434 (-),score=96.17 TRINITY_DN113065_c0_g1_i1:429-1730(-)
MVPLAVLALGLLAATIYCFIGLAVLCDDFLVPNIEFICGRFSIPDEVAGATLLALGAAAPELAIMTVATAYGTPDVGSDVLLQSSMIAFGAIPALCILTVRRTLKLQVYPLLRDTLFYVLGLSTLFTLLHVNDGVMEVKDNAILIAEYIVYLIVLAVFSRFSFEEEEETRQEALRASLKDNDALAGSNSQDGEKPKLSRRRSRSGSLPDRKAHASDAPQTDGGDEEEESSLLGKAYELISKPYALIFSCTTYPVPGEGEEEDAPVWKVVVSTFMSLFFLFVLSKFSYDAVQALVSAMSLEKSALGSTVLAIGSQVPDTIGAIAMTKADMADGAISSAIGSQVMQMTVGVGVPWMIYNCYYGSLDLDLNGGMGALSTLLPLTGFTVLIYFVVVVCPGIVARSHVSEFKTESGTILLGVFAASMVAAVVVSDGWL